MVHPSQVVLHLIAAPFLVLYVLVASKILGECPHHRLLNRKVDPIIIGAGLTVSLSLVRSGAVFSIYRLQPSSETGHLAARTPSIQLHRYAWRVASLVVEILYLVL